MCIISKEELKDLMEEYKEDICCEKCGNLNECDTYSEGCMGYIRNNGKYE